VSINVFFKLSNTKVCVLTAQNPVFEHKLSKSVVSKTMSFLRQKSVETTDFSVNSTDKSVRRTVYGQLDYKPNVPVSQQILFFGVQARELGILKFSRITIYKNS
jgi:hypothetical protein